MIKIRPAIRSEAVALLQVHREAVFAKAAGHYDRDRLEAWSPGPTPERVQRIEQEIDDPGYIVRVAELEGQIIGFAMAIPSKNELRALYVKPNAEGNVGRVLLADIEKLAFEAGASALEFDASTNAEAFYAANGYHVTGRADHVSLNGDKSPAVQMKKVRSE